MEDLKPLSARHPRPHPQLFLGFAFTPLPVITKGWHLLTAGALGACAGALWNPRLETP